MGKLFVIMGKSATGKDSLYGRLLERNPQLKRVISYTTRPIRAGETNGREYHFVSREQMDQMEAQGRIIECRRYDTVLGPWFYFTADDGQIDFTGGDYIIITTLEGYERLRAYYGADSIIPIYIEVEDFERLARAMERERSQESPCVPELCRRFLADEEDFSEEKLRKAGIGNRIVNDDFDRALLHIEKLLADNAHVVLD